MVLRAQKWAPNWYRFHAVSFDQAQCRTTAGLYVTTHDAPEWVEKSDTIIIPGWSIGRDVPQSLITALQKAHARGARIVTICSGVFVPAAAGLLDGKRVTTHWKFIDQARALYPDLHNVPDVLYIDEGQILTSAGSAAGIDLCLHLIRRDFGPEAANMVARRLVIPAHRDGGQAQYITQSVPIVRESNRLGPLLDHMRENLSETFSVAQLSKRTGMSRRTFLRRFSEATGTTPAKWLLQTRLQYARDLLEASNLNIEAIALTCGFGSATNFRHHFRDILFTTPTAYRHRFQKLRA